MNSIKYSYEQLKKLCCDAFAGFGFSQEEAEQITDVLLLADLYGIRSHGTQRLVRYHKGIENDTIKIDAKPEIVFETPVSAVIDGHSGMGQLISVYAMKLAIKKAKEVGMAFVTVRNSNHYGIAGYYSKMACDEGLIGISTTNSESIAVHTNSKQAILGSNPIAFAMPAEPYPFWFDAATTVVPRGRLEVYNKENKPIAQSWAVDEEGKTCTDAERVLECINDKNSAGGILVLGGKTEQDGSHKGYGYSMISEILCAITSGGSTSNHHVRKKGQGAGTCHSFIVIDPKIFGDTETIKDHLSVFLQELRDAERADGEIPIYTHGEKEFINAEKVLKEGIDVNINTVAEMVRLCDYLGMNSVEYLGEVDISGTKQGNYDKVYK
ncbi:MAG: Ldh family oxidoreductase [Clostridia bacterium]|nr:Ldh family oxidoreductase [Clostridia bacterium]